MVKDDAKLFRAGNRLLIRDDGYLKDAITGLVTNFWSDTMSGNTLDPGSLQIATYAQLMVDICPLKGIY